MVPRQKSGNDTELKEVEERHKGYGSSSEGPRKNNGYSIRRRERQGQTQMIRAKS